MVLSQAIDRMRPFLSNSFINHLNFMFIVVLRRILFSFLNLILDRTLILVRNHAPNLYLILDHPYRMETLHNKAVALA
jgi:hypothetical protein